MGKGSAATTPAATPEKMQFHFSSDEEPHVARRQAIQKAHPEVKELMVTEPVTKYYVLLTVAIQIAAAAYASTLPTGGWAWWTLAYVIGGTANHSLFLAIHELSHNLGSKAVDLKFMRIERNDTNKFISLVANLPIGIPYCIVFKPFHMEHHKYQGHDGVDTDIPDMLELWVVYSSSKVVYALKKAVYLAVYIFLYALRPCLTRPDKLIKDGWLVFNYVLQIGFDLLIVKLFGWSAFLYFLASTFMAGSLHPMAGHFIAEHYTIDGGKTETYSYYGWLNNLAYNVGYHNEHHDFPNIPWTKLPELRKIAPEFYEDLPKCESWVGIMVKYILDDNIGPHSRVKRTPKE